MPELATIFPYPDKYEIVGVSIVESKSTRKNKLDETGIKLILAWSCWIFNVIKMLLIQASCVHC